MLKTTDDLRIRAIAALAPPAQLIEEFPPTAVVTDTVATARKGLHQIIHGEDGRLIVVIGPCSIHDPIAALDYATRLQKQRVRFSDALEVIMRVYFEKPRTTVGWKGLINDPMLDGSFKINEGLRIARKLLVDINSIGLPVGCEFLDTMTPQYIADLVSWGAIGARTTESQIHRQLASGLSCPVGFKNSTDGDVEIAIDGVAAASYPHHFLALTKDGRAAIAATTGNKDCHIVLRGGRTPNYDAASVAAASDQIAKSGLPSRLMIDASHANSGKNPENQSGVIAAIAQQIAAGDQRIIGVMAESHLVAGRQDLIPGKNLVYGHSITDGCLGWEESVIGLEKLASAVTSRRRKVSLF